MIRGAGTQATGGPQGQASGGTQGISGAGALDGQWQSWLGQGCGSWDTGKGAGEQTSHVAVPMHMVPKKYQSCRWTVELRPLNKHLMESLFLQASRIPLGTWKLCVDAYNGYHLLPLHKKSKELTAFLMPLGKYHNLVNPWCITRSWRSWLLELLHQWLHSVGPGGHWPLLPSGLVPGSQILPPRTHQIQIWQDRSGCKDKNLSNGQKMKFGLHTPLWI